VGFQLDVEIPPLAEQGEVVALPRTHRGGRWVVVAEQVEGEQQPPTSVGNVQLDAESRAAGDGLAAKTGMTLQEATAAVDRLRNAVTFNLPATDGSLSA
jgi:hypothetical protein